MSCARLHDFQFLTFFDLSLARIWRRPSSLVRVRINNTVDNATPITLLNKPGDVFAFVCHFCIFACFVLVLFNECNACKKKTEGERGGTKGKERRGKRKKITSGNRQISFSPLCNLLSCPRSCLLPLPLSSLLCPSLYTPCICTILHPAQPLEIVYVLPLYSTFSSLLWIALWILWMGGKDIHKKNERKD